MKSNEMIQRDVVDELAWDPQVDGSGIGVQVKDGIATLTGQVGSYAEKLAAEKATRRVSGVKAIAEELEVRPSTVYQRDDSAIAKAALDALRWNVMVPDDKIQVTVDRGWIKLQGEVPWFYQRKAAERAVRYLSGVKGVMNLLAIEPRADVPEIRSKIEAAFKRSAALDAELIKVDVVRGKVALKGKVRSWAELDEAEAAAWATPGVTSVKNQLDVEAPAFAL